MNSHTSFWLSLAYVVLIVLYGLFNLFWTSVFFLGSKEEAIVQIYQGGLLKILAMRFVAFV